MFIVADLFFRIRSPFARAAVALAAYAYAWFVVVGLTTLCSLPLMGLPIRIS
jgi:hypothetical protein